MTEWMLFLFAMCLTTIVVMATLGVVGFIARLLWEGWQDFRRSRKRWND